MELENSEGRGRGSWTSAELGSVPLRETDNVTGGGSLGNRLLWYFAFCACNASEETKPHPTILMVYFTVMLQKEFPQSRDLAQTILSQTSLTRSDGSPQASSLFLLCVQSGQSRRSKWGTLIPAASTLIKSQREDWTLLFPLGIFFQKVKNPTGLPWASSLHLGEKKKNLLVLC